MWWASPIQALTRDLREFNGMEFGGYPVMLSVTERKIIPS
jgi:hypothetical protein